MSKKALRREARIAQAKERDTELFLRGAGDEETINELRKLDGKKLGKLLLNSQCDARPMSPTRAVSLRVLGAAQALVNERQAARAAREELQQAHAALSSEQAAL